jgi:hypothetical protein
MDTIPENEWYRVINTKMVDITFTGFSDTETVELNKYVKPYLSNIIPSGSIINYH